MFNGDLFRTVVRAGGNPERKVEETVLPDKFLCGQV